MNPIFVVNPPEDFSERKTHITKDMAGGFGFNADRGVVLPSLELIYHVLGLRQRDIGSSFYDLQAEPERMGGFFGRINSIKNTVTFLILATPPTMEGDLKFIRQVKESSPSSKIFVKFDLKNKEVMERIFVTGLVDLILFGETERELAEIIGGDSRRGAAWCENGKVVFGEDLMIENMEDLPEMDVDFLNLKKYKYTLLPGQVFTFQSSRGCPFSCAYYCPYPLIQGNRWRAMSSSKLYRNIELLVKKFGIGSVLFRDATFTLNKERTKQFCHLIINNKLDFSWWCETRMNCLDEELLELMAKAGCRGINIGVETGDDILMRTQGKVGGNVEMLLSVSRLAGKCGISLHFLMMVGLPDETKRTLYNSYRLIEKVKPKSLGVTTITPYPGTQLYEEALRQGLITDFNLSRYIGNLPVMRTESLSEKQIGFGRFLLQVGGYLNRRTSPFFVLSAIFFRIFFWLWSRF